MPTKKLRTPYTTEDSSITLPSMEMTKKPSNNKLNRNSSKRLPHGRLVKFNSSTNSYLSRIAVDNQAKIEAGLNVKVKPYNPLDDFDQTGLKLGLKKHTFFKPKYVLG